MSQPSLAFDLEDREPTLSVTELAEAINGALRRRFDDGLWVRGEIQGWRKSAAGHIYFDLVDFGEDEEVFGAGTGSGTVSTMSGGRGGRGRPAQATIKIAFFAGAQHGPREKFRRERLKLGDGLKVRIYGSLDFFAAGGSVTFKMTDIDVRFTLGDMLQARADTVRRLIAQGLYDANRRHQLSDVPLRVGVVTSVGSAAWADFTDELHRSGYGFQLIACNARVQGDGAAAMVAAAISSLSAHHEVDVIVVLRGGGARTELAVFDDERIALAIAAAPVPVLTGVGHEIDRSVADEVAHTALKTPTACAHELVTRVRLAAARAEQAWSRIAETAARSVTDADRDLVARAAAARHRTTKAVEQGMQRLNLRAVRLTSAARRATGLAEAHLHGAAAAVGRAAFEPDRELVLLDARAARVRALDPAVAMARGWSITRTRDGLTVRSATQLSQGDTLITSFVDGEALSIVQDIR
jgi:exodeoxyribonuclease VII large subunit